MGTILYAKIFILLTTVYITVGNPLPRSESSEQYERDEKGAYILRPSPLTAGKFRKAAVATSSPQCAKSGARIMEKGGHAVEGAIAALLCDGVVSLQGMGIGGGFLMTIWDAKEKKSHFLNAREYAPAKASERMFTTANSQNATLGGLAVAVPGEIAGYWAAHQKFGKLPWADLFEDVIKICEEGSDVSRYVANDLRKIECQLREPRFATLKNIVTSKQDPRRLVDVGEKIPRKELAETFKKIRDHGKDIFYEGEIARNLVDTIQAAGGIVDLDDFKNYQVQWKNPVSTTVNNYKVYSAPTPGSGAIISFILNVLEPLIPAPNDNILYQRIAETIKWAYARRNEIGDFTERPEYADKRTKGDCKIPPEQVQKYAEAGYTFSERGDDKWDKDCLMSLALRKLLDKDYAAQVRGLIKDDWTSNNYNFYNITKEGRIDLGTAHTSVYGEDGSAVAVTSTINHLCGSMVTCEKTGIILNNEMDDYSYPGVVNGFGVEPSEFNFVRNKSSTLRPMSSMSPTIILNPDDTVRLVIGSAGGTKITTGVAQGIILNLLLGLDTKDALDHPRIHHNLWPMAVQREPDFDQNIINYLHSIGHKIEGWLIMQNTLAAISVYGKCNVTASGDYRREGGSAGY